MFANLLSSFVMHDINPKNSKKHCSMLGSPCGWSHCFSSNQGHLSIRTYWQQVPSPLLWSAPYGFSIWQEVKTVTRKEQLMLIVHQEDFKNDDDTYIELYVVKRFWMVHKEGDSDYFLMHRLLLLKKKTRMSRGCFPMPLEGT